MADAMILDLSDEEARALLNVLIEIIENDRYPMSPRVRLLQAILGKCGEVGGLPSELAARLRWSSSAPPPFSFLVPLARTTCPGTVGYSRCKAERLDLPLRKTRSCPLRDPTRGCAPRYYPV